MGVRVPNSPSLSLLMPALKNKLFWFYSYEGLRNNSTDFTTAFVETPQYREAVIAARPNSVTAKIFQAAGIERG